MGGRIMALQAEHLEHLPDDGGKPDGLAPIELSDIAAGHGGFAFNGAAEGDFSGTSVSGAGDVNGDGLADLIVGAPFANLKSDYSGEGQSYVVFGKACGTAVELSDIAAGQGGFALNGAAEGDGSGISVSGAGDVNGDGLADLIVGAFGADPAEGGITAVCGHPTPTASGQHAAAVLNFLFIKNEQGEDGDASDLEPCRLYGAGRHALGLGGRGTGG